MNLANLANLDIFTFPFILVLLFCEFYRVYHLFLNNSNNGVSILLHVGFSSCFGSVSSSRAEQTAESRKTKMASLQPKTNGGPATKFWEAQETISALEHVKGWLCKHTKKVDTIKAIKS